MNRILLVGDVQLNKRDLYHVGDEAAFNEVVRRLNAEVGDEIRISKFVEGIPSPEVGMRWVTDIVNLNRCPEDLCRALKGIDIVWFVGSGNLNSLFRDYLYHRVALMLTASALSITTIVTSQTIGPFENRDREIFYLGIKNVDYLSIRDKIGSAEELETLGIDYKVSSDDATDLPFKKREFSDKVQVGISLRDWDADLTVQKAKQLIRRIQGVTEIHLIPHLIDQNDNLDIGFMKNHFSGKFYDYAYFRNSQARFDIEVKSLTASMDVMITSRYHGAVFATSTRVKTIALHDNIYYQQKMEGLLSLKAPDLLVVDAKRDLDDEVISEFLQAMPNTDYSMKLPSTNEIIISAKKTL